MKKMLTGALVVVFAGLLTTSIVSVYSQDDLDNQYIGMLGQHPYFMAY